MLLCWVLASSVSKQRPKCDGKGRGARNGAGEFTGFIASDAFFVTEQGRRDVTGNLGASFHATRE